jgi:hypothetical protein
MDLSPGLGSSAGPRPLVPFITTIGPAPVDARTLPARAPSERAGRATLCRTGRAALVRPPGVPACGASTISGEEAGR